MKAFKAEGYLESRGERREEWLLVNASMLDQMQKDERLDVILAMKEKYGKVPVCVHVTDTH